MNHIMITGVSSGVGYALAAEYLQRGSIVTGLSRREVSLATTHESFRWCAYDLSQDVAPAEQLSAALADRARIDVLYLNAGMCPPIQSFANESLVSIEQLMRTNVWGNKLLIEALVASNVEIAQVIAISSGAAIHAYKGMGSYAISKAALNAWVQLMAQEYPQTHWTALAPGIIETSMQDVICGSSPEEEFPILQKLQTARDAGAMLSPEECARHIVRTSEGLRDLESGCFADLRNYI